MDMDKLVSLCKRRGFIFPSSEIYGGINGFWDYGPLGVELKRNIKEAWWRDNIMMRDDMVGLDSSIIMNPRVWEASGHVGGFNDPMVDCRACKGRFRADQVTIVVIFPSEAANVDYHSIPDQYWFSAIGDDFNVLESNEKEIKRAIRQLKKEDEEVTRLGLSLIKYVGKPEYEKFPCPACKKQRTLTE